MIMVEDAVSSLQNLPKLFNWVEVLLLWRQEQMIYILLILIEPFSKVALCPAYGAELSCRQPRPSPYYKSHQTEELCINLP